MKLLALRLCDHDSNFSYFDGKKLHYFKSERLRQDKHHAYNNLWQWKFDLIKYFGVDPNDLDEIAIVVDSNNYGDDQTEDFIYEEYSRLNVNCPVWKLEHHHAHAYSDWMNGKSEYQVVFDGFGEEFWTQDKTSKIVTAWSIFKNYELIERGYAPYNPVINHYDTLGCRYERMSEIIGVRATHSIDLAGKAMSLLSYGNFNEGYARQLRELSLDKDIDTLFHDDPWITYHGDSVLLAELKKLDWAKTVHYVTGDLLVDFFKDRFKATDKIFYSGGCAQNVSWNTTLKNNFPNLQVLPHSADDGLSLGAIEWLRIKNHLEPFTLSKFPYAQSDEEPKFYASKNTIKKTAEKLARGEIVGWYQGKGEIGPRALGNRSILMNPAIPDGKNLINQRVKHREEYRPFGATVLAEYEKDYFDLDYTNPYMLYLSTMKQNLPAIEHIDNTCRHQTLGNENHVYRELIKEFHKLTGLPVLLNTSLNRGGKPIAGNIEDAYGVFVETELNTLVIGDEMVSKG